HVGHSFAEHRGVLVGGLRWIRAIAGVRGEQPRLAPGRIDRCLATEPQLEAREAEHREKEKPDQQADQRDRVEAVQLRRRSRTVVRTGIEVLLPEALRLSAAVA